MKVITPDFSPSLFHPFYFVRTGLRNAIETYAPQLGGNLMDFGCGSKPYKRLFVVERYIGVDFQNEGHPHEKEEIDVFYNGKNLPFEDEYFDSVLCSEVIEHIFNLDEVLAEIRRVTKKNGKILITCPFVWNEHEVPFDYARYSRFALKDILSRAGFRILEYSKSGNFITALAQMRIIYFRELLQERSRKFLLTRWLYKLLFVFIPNVAGLVLEKILPRNDTLYLNNIVLAERI